MYWTDRETERERGEREINKKARCIGQIERQRQTEGARETETEREGKIYKRARCDLSLQIRLNIGQIERQRQT